MKHILTIFQTALIFIFMVQATSAQIIPVKSGDKYTLSVGDIHFEVDASFGARITSFKFDDNEMLLPGRNMTGSTLWTSPQSEWNWPPLNTTDNKAYTASIEGDKMIFVSDEEKGMSGKNFKFIKTFWANESNNSISVRYSMVNTGSSALTNALWAVTRVEPNGLTFWETGDKEPWGGTWGESLVNKIEEEANHYWIEFDIANGTSNKFFSGIGKAGWFAHVNNDNVILIKSFEDVSVSDYATGEGEFEYYTGGNYIELENQGKYAAVAAGDTLHYDVTWHLCQLPDNVPAEIGNSELIDFVQKVVESEGTNGVDEFVISNVNVFPNPVKDVFTVEINESFANVANFNLYDMSGRLMRSTKVEGSVQVDVSDLGSGAYFYSIVSDQKTSKGKLIKQ